MIVVCPNCKGTGETGPFHPPPDYEETYATCHLCEGGRVVHETTRTVYNTIRYPYRFELKKVDRHAESEG